MAVCIIFVIDALLLSMRKSFRLIDKVTHQAY
jgi:hypothetical protein